MDIDTPHSPAAPKKKVSATARLFSHSRLQSLPSPLLRAHILSYLVRNCYRKTALAFIRAEYATSQGVVLSERQLKELDARRDMMNAVKSGDIMAGVREAERLLGGGLKDVCPMMYVRLLCQYFVELLRRRHILSAVALLQQTLSPLGKAYPDALPLLQTYVPLLAYKQPELSPVFELVDVEKRHILAEELNGYVYGYLKVGVSEVESELERLLRQLTMVMRRLPEGGGSWCVSEIMDTSDTGV